MIENLKHREILIKKAKEDLEAAERLVETEGYSEEIVLFHCQQGIEKALKAFLDSQGVIYPKTHDLETLLSMCIKKDKSFQKIDHITSLTPYAVEIRYDEFVPLSEEEVQQNISKTKEAINFILERI